MLHSPAQEGICARNASVCSPCGEEVRQPRLLAHARKATGSVYYLHSDLVSCLRNKTRFLFFTSPVCMQTFFFPFTLFRHIPLTTMTYCNRCRFHTHTHTHTFKRVVALTSFCTPARISRHTQGFLCGLHTCRTNFSTLRISSPPCLSIC